ncbi:unnamed protein product [Angiostrongylus costaricensis]|uniref:Uncharacterized protein n=1 Tax=Angiostrongylus costaricensis TaxID=334426 RepID=A0A0R3Q0W0_ANGCS|nr:unnamed protein product [Angiostrongylus costaricensis]
MTVCSVYLNTCPSDEFSIADKKDWLVRIDDNDDDDEAGDCVCLFTRRRRMLACRSIGGKLAVVVKICVKETG